MGKQSVNGRNARSRRTPGIMLEVLSSFSDGLRLREMIPFATHPEVYVDFGHGAET